MILYFERVSISVCVGNNEEDNEEYNVGEQFIGHGLAPHLLDSSLLQSLEKILAIGSRNKYVKPKVNFSSLYYR